MPEKNDKEIIERLNIIINLLLRICIDKKLKFTSREQIKILNDIGISSGNIGKIIAKKTHYVTANLSQIKKRINNHNV